MHPNSIIAALVLLLLPFERATAKGDDQGTKDNSLPSEATTNCYNPSDPNEIRLWEGRAPGSSGDDPCRDIPFLHLYAAPDASQALRPAILLIPGGGLRSSNRPERAGSRRRLLLAEIGTDDLCVVLSLSSD